MKYNKTQLLIFIAFLISSLTLSFFYFRTYQNMKSTLNTSEEERITLKLMLHLENVENYLVDIGISESGIITQQNQFFSRFIEAVDSCKKEITSLYKINSTNHVSQKGIENLDTIVTARIVFAQMLINLSLQGKNEEAMRLFKTSKGSSLRLAAKRQIVSLENEGRIKLHEYKELHNLSAQRTYNLFGFMGLIALLLMGYAFFKILQDDTVKKKLAKQNSFLNQVANNTSDAIVTFDPFEVITSWNKAAEKMYGKKAKDVLGKTADEAFGRKDDNSNTTKIIKDQLKATGHWSGEITDTHANGKPMYMQVSVTALKNKEEEIISYVSIGNNITAQKKATKKIIELDDEVKTLAETLQEKVEEQTAKLTALIEHTPAYLTEINREGVIVNLNKAYGSLSNKEDIIGTLLCEQSSDEEQNKKIKSIIDYVFITNEPYFYEHSFPDANNELRRYSVNYIPVIINDKTESIIYTAYDITEQKKIQESAAQLASIMDNSEVLVGIMNMNFKIDYINHAGKKRIGIGEDEDFKQLDAVNFFSFDGKFDEKILAEVFKTGKWVGENVLLSTTKEVIPVMQVLMLHKNEKSEPAFISSTAIDISDIKKKEKELNKLAGIVENTQALVLIVDLELKVQYLNKAAKKRLGVGDDEDVTNLSGLDFTPPETIKLMKREEEKFFADGKWVGELNIKTRDGEVFPVLEVAIIHKDEQGAPQYLSFTFLDISELKQKEAELKSLTSIIENSPAYISMADLNKNFIYVNPAFRDAFEISKDEDITKLNIASFRSPKSREIIKNGAEENLKNGKWTGSNTFISRSGKEIPVLQVLVLHKNEKGEPDHVSFTAIDLSIQKNAEKELKKMNADLRHLSGHLQTVREEERKEIAREIHDEFGQNLTVLKMDAAWLKNHLDPSTNNTKIIEKLNELMEIADDTIQTSRRLYNSLHPSMLDDIGLIAAVEWQAKTFTKSTDILVEVHSNIHDQKFTQQISIGLFRICQESLTNILRHSKATNVIINITKKDSTIFLSIKDNGEGFDQTSINTTNRHGLLGMRERVYALNGTLNIDSSKEKGTSISIEVPID